MAYSEPCPDMQADPAGRARQHAPLQRLRRIARVGLSDLCTAQRRIHAHTRERAYCLQPARCAWQANWP
eukprot:14116071-Alexandrium_andersonii.AAC.1